MKCPNCYAEATGKFCEYCGSELPRDKTVTNINNRSKTIINNFYSGSTSSLRQAQALNRESFYREPFRRVSSNRQPPGLSAEMSSQKSDSVGTTILLLVFFFPFGLIRMWTRKHFSKNARIVITVFFILLTIATLVSNYSNSAGSTDPVPVSDTTPESIVYTTDSDSDAVTKKFLHGFENFIQIEERKP